MKLRRKSAWIVYQLTMAFNPWIQWFSSYTCFLFELSLFFEINQKPKSKIHKSSWLFNEKLELSNYHANTKVFELTLLFGEEILFSFLKYPIFFLSKLLSNCFKSKCGKNEFKFRFAWIPKAQSGKFVNFPNFVIDSSTRTRLFEHLNRQFDLVSGLCKFEYSNVYLSTPTYILAL